MSSFQSLAKSRTTRLASSPFRATKSAVSPSSSSSSSSSSSTPSPHSSSAPSASSSSSSSSTASPLPPLPPQLEIKTHPTKGRAVWIKQSGHPTERPQPVVFKAGATILSTPPHAASLSSSALQTVCSACFLNPDEIRQNQHRLRRHPYHHPQNTPDGPPVKLIQCTGCRVVRYCSPDCRSTDWADHELECLALSSLQTHRPVDQAHADKSVPGEAVRALGRLCAKRKRLVEFSSSTTITTTKNKGKGKEGDDSWWAEISRLDCQRSAMPLADPSTGAPAPYAQLALQLGVYLGHALHPSHSSSPNPNPKDEEIPPADMTQFGFESVSEVLDLCASFMTNSFTLSSPSLAPIGVAIAPSVALFNHSCWPNAVVVFPFGGHGSKGDGSSMDVVALRDLVEGEQIVTAYIDISLPSQLRQAELQARYFFKCDCDLCARPSADPRDMVRPRPSYDGLEDWVLSGMKLLKMEQQGTLVDFDQLLTKASPMSVIGSLAYFYPPWAYPLFPLLRLLSTLLISSLSAFPADASPGRTERLEDAIRCALLVSECMAHRSIYPVNHPARALARAELGKLLLLLPPPPPPPSTPPPSPSPGPPAAPSSSSSSALPAGLFELAQTTLESIPTEPLARLRLARDVLTDALGELRAGFGRPDGGLVGIEIAGLVEGVSREIEMLRTMSR